MSRYITYVSFVIKAKFQHYKRDADGLCHRYQIKKTYMLYLFYYYELRLVSPIVSEAFRLTCDSPNNEERTKEFSRANLLLNGNDLKVSNESVLGHGEFGGKLLIFYFLMKIFYF